jgi:hypothetical protein
MFTFNKIKKLINKAENGDLEALMELGERYRTGEDVEKSLPRSYAQFAIAARQGHLEAIFQVGMCQDAGIGCDIDPAKAFYNFNEAAKRGHPGALLKLAQYYENGYGGIVDMDKANACYEKARQLGASMEDVTPATTSTPEQRGFLHLDSGPNAPKVTSESEMSLEDNQLSHIPFFSGLKNSELFEIMSKTGNISLKVGQHLFLEEQSPNGLFILLTGKCSVYIKPLGSSQNLVLKTFSAGEYLGEFGLIDSLPRSASALITEDAELLFLPTVVFRAALEKIPNLAKIVTANLANSIVEQKIKLGDKHMMNLINQGVELRPSIATMQVLVGALRQNNIDKAYH